MLGRIEAGTWRRYPTRRAPTPSATPRRSSAPRHRQDFGWLVALIPETAQGAGLLEALLHQPDMAERLSAAPQLRRLLRPLCRMLGVRAPRPAPRPAPIAATAEPPPPPPAPVAPTCTRRAARTAAPPTHRDPALTA